MFNPSKYIKITIFILVVFLATNIALPAIYSRQLVKTAEAADTSGIKGASDAAGELTKRFPYMEVFLGLSASLFAACAIAGIKVLGTGVEITGICNIVNKVIDWLEIHAKDYFNAFLKKKLLDYLADSIIRWVQGEGKPLFVTNWRQFLGKVINDSVGEYIKTTEAAFLCQPFKAQVILNIPMPGRPPLPTCTLNQVVGNIEDFYDDFRNGGWIAYNEMLYPWNNPYGSYLMALDGAIFEAAAAAAESEKEAQQAQGGFLSIKRCKPGMEIIDPFTNESVCIEEETVTPGNVVSEQVTKALGSSLDFIASSDDLSVYIAAIADAAINRLIKETIGGGGLLTMSASNAPEELGTAPSPDYFTANYSCISGVCQQTEEGEYEGLEACTAECFLRFSCVNSACTIDPNGKFSSLDDCQTVCKESEEPSCSFCTGTYVRGRYSYPYNQNPNDKDCSGSLCGKCSSVSPGKGACGAFCQNIVSSELWPEEEIGVPHTFNSDVLNQYQALFSKLGFTTPTTCTCNRAILGNQWSSYGISAGGGACRGCTDLPIGAVCSSVDWCDQNCIGTEPKPTHTPEPTPVCSACNGVFVRGRYYTSSSDSNNSLDCDGPNCKACSAPAVLTPCNAFCLNTKENTWTGTKIFTQQEMLNLGYQVLFDHFGWEVPNSCTCRQPIDNYDFGMGYGSGLCQDCIALPNAKPTPNADNSNPTPYPYNFAACKSTQWCEQNCGQ